MKINPTAAFQAYNKMAEHNRSPRQAELSADDKMQRGGHTDQIQISPAGAQNGDRPIDQGHCVGDQDAGFPGASGKAADGCS